jgi:DNA repair exonuclease SbcCD ATPase subunit
MKRIKFLLPVVVFIMASTSASSQKYKTPADTMRLNKEIVEVSNDIASLTSKLSIAQNNLPGYHSKASEAASDAQNTAIESSASASKATSGNLSDAKSANKKAKKALNDAQDARSADNRVKGQDKKIAKLTAELSKKQEKLKDLEEMRTAIRSMPQ